MLTGGGDCPGLNAVIRAVVRKGIDGHGHAIVGFRDGWRGPLENAYDELTIESTRGILPRGGTILRSSRTNPFTHDGGPERIAENMRSLNLEGLIAIGGEDTLGAAARLHGEHGLPVVGVPKTIDNDLGGTDMTFGFDTAVQIATEAIDRLHTTAESHNRVMIVEVMGRHAGWIALYSGLAGGADVILIPERPFDIEEVVRLIRRRHSRGRFFSIVVVAEGAAPQEGTLRGRAPATATSSGTSGWAASASCSSASSASAPASTPARRCWGTSSAAARRPPSTACSRPASGSQRSTPRTTASGA